MVQIACLAMSQTVDRAILLRLFVRLKRTLSDKRRMSFNVAMHYPVITVYYAASNKH